MEQVREAVAFAVVVLIASFSTDGSAVGEPTDRMARPPTQAVTYEAFGAKGDGRSDDAAAIAAAHAHANEHGLPVRANDNATYYVGGGDVTAIVQTDTDFGTARFVIDDRAVAERRSQVFEVRSTQQPIRLTTPTSLRRGQVRIDADLPGLSVVVATDERVKRFIRRGLNPTAGSAQTDVFVVDAEGRVSADTPIIWDFAQLTELTALPIDDEQLTIRGGHFTTIANQAESKYTYYSRGLVIRRSNVLVDRLQHYVTGEGDQGAPYAGFLAVRDAANVTIRNAVLTGRKTYRTIGRAGKPVSMGSYDITIRRSINVTLEDCKQSNDINDSRFWGVMASNFGKNLRYVGCELSRFDAHMGVVNASIEGSTIGHAGINLIGSGSFRMKNSTSYGRSLVNLRPDYGSTWHGEILIEDCTFVPAAGREAAASLIQGHNDARHDFGYACSMPTRVVIRRLYIDDSNHPNRYSGPTIFANFNPKLIDDSHSSPFPYTVTNEVVLSGVTTASGEPIRLSDNPYMFESVDFRVD